VIRTKERRTVLDDLEDKSKWKKFPKIKNDSARIHGGRIAVKNKVK
jgi:hypothetical protein